MVNPGGTGRPRLHISARLAPLPPSKFLSPARPSAAPSPKVYTHLVMLVPRHSTAAACVCPRLLCSRSVKLLRCERQHVLRPDQLLQSIKESSCPKACAPRTNCLEHKENTRTP